MVPTIDNARPRSASTAALRALMPALLLLLGVLVPSACGLPAQPSDPPAGRATKAKLPGPPSPNPPPSPTPVPCPAYESGLGVSPTGPEPTPAAGTIPGSFAVTSTGEASYTMPLVSPPGRAGIEPSLALAYDTASGDGVLGMGFRVAGLSSIARCPSNVAQDGNIRPVEDDSSDKLCLDGKRLVPVGTNSGSVEYRTFPDTFVRVLAPSGTRAGPLPEGRTTSRCTSDRGASASTATATTARCSARAGWCARGPSDDPQIASGVTSQAARSSAGRSTTTSPSRSGPSRWRRSRRV